MRSGKMPDVKDLLHMCVKVELMKGELIFNNLFDFHHNQRNFLGLMDFIMFSISLVDTNFTVKLGK
jgi:hypothetical protein